MNIFCFPYAGGSKYMYFELKKKLGNSVKLIPIDYPGHATRANEALIDSPEKLADDMFFQMQMHDDGSPFALLGYSMGSRIAYLIYHKYKNTPLMRRLSCIILCAMTFHFDCNDKAPINWNDEDFMNYVISLGGSDIEDAEDLEAYREFLPVIRNDLILVSNADKLLRLLPDSVIDKKVYVFYSSDEKHIRDFDAHCSLPVDYCFFDGGHFFIKSFTDKMATEIKRIICSK